MLLFAIGLIGSGVLAVPVLTGSAASGVSEASRWRSGLERRPTRAPQFYVVIVAATLVGMAINFLGINPITALVWSAVLNGLIAPPLLILVMLVSNDRAAMGGEPATPTTRMVQREMVEAPGNGRDENVIHDGSHGGHTLEDELEPRLTPDRPRRATAEDMQRFEGYLAEILTAMGLDLDTPGTRPTPRRFLRAMFDSTSGYEGDPKLLTAFPTECRGGANCEIAQVVEGPIPFFALCEHHALPFFGDVYVGYVAHEGIIGISKLTRLVRVITRRFGVQERMTYQIGEELDRLMQPHGVAVYVEAHHLCTQMRGVRELHPKTRTTSYRGAYVNTPQLRSEFFDVAGLRRGAS